MVLNRAENSYCEYFYHQLGIKVAEWWRVCITKYDIILINCTIRQRTASAIISTQLSDTEDEKVDLDGDGIELNIDIGMVFILSYVSLS